MLGVRSVSGLAFYDWESLELVRRIDIQPKHVYWSENGDLVSIATEDSFYILKYDPDAVAKAREVKEGVTEDGIEEAFDVLGEVQESVKTGLWVGDCFIYTNSVNRLNYYVGGEIVTIAHLDRTMYVLGYIPKESRLFLGDKELNVVSYSLLLSVLEYQTAVMRRDFEMADKVLPTIPKEQRTRVAHFLEKQGFKAQALAVSTDPEHRFELCLQLGDTKTAHQLAMEAQSEQKWKQLAELALARGDFALAQECLHNAQDFAGLLLLATSASNASMIAKLATSAEAMGKNNVAFLAKFLLGDAGKALDVLLETKRYPEAAFFAKCYVPSQTSRAVKLWKEELAKISEKSAQALADPEDYENLFPGLQESIKAQEFLKNQSLPGKVPAAEFPNAVPNHDRNPIEEMKAALAMGTFVPTSLPLGGSASVPEAKPQTAAATAASPREDPKGKDNDEDVDLDQLERELESDIENLALDENVENIDYKLPEDLLSDD